MQTNLLKPKAIQVEPLGGNRAKVTLEPFERGYGHTLGNALRRVLLSSMVGLCAHRSDDRRRAARVLDRRRRAGRRGPHHAEPEGRGVPPAQPRRSHAGAAQGRRRPGHGRRHPDAARRRNHQPRSRHRPPVARRQAGHADQGREGPWLCAGHLAPLRRRADQGHRPHRARCLVLAGAPRQLRGGKRPRRAAHRPGQAGHGDPDQRRHLARGSDPRVGQDPGRAAGRLRAARRQRDLLSSSSPPQRPTKLSTRSCCARSTSSNSPCVRPTA